MAEDPKKSAEVTQSSIAQPANNLLTSDESTLIQKVSSSKPPHSQRALALLALEENLSLSESAQRSGLTSRQVRYWRDRFLAKGMEIFPVELIAPTEVDKQPLVEKPKKDKKVKKLGKTKKSKGKKMTKKKDKKKKQDKKSKKGKKDKK